MTQLWAWEYEGKTEYGWKHWERTSVFLDVAEHSSVSPIRDISQVTNLRKAKVVDEDVYDPTPPITKTYLNTEQFIKVWKSLDDDNYKELKSAWDTAWDDAWDDARYAARYAAREADLAIVVHDKITPDQFNILVQPWISCGLSLYAEDWEEVLNPKVVEPKNFGAIVEASTRHYGFQSWFLAKNGTWTGENEHHIDWSDLINPTIISEGVES